MVSARPPLARIVSAALPAAVITAVAAPSVAQMPKVLVFPILPASGEEVPREVTEELTANLLEELLKGGELDVYVGPDLRDVRLSRRHRQGPADAGRERAPLPEGVGPGLEHARRGEWALAVERLQPAFEALSRGSPWDDAALYIEVATRLALSLHHLGRVADEQATLESLLTFRPRLLLASEDFPEAFANSVENARRALAGRATGGIEVVTVPPAVEVTLNGVALGQTPLLIEHVPPGRYRLELLKEMRRWWAQVQVEAASTLEYYVDLSDAKVPGKQLARSLAANRFTPEGRRATLELAEEEKMDFVFVGILATTEVELLMAGFIGEVATGLWRRMPTVRVDRQVLAVDMVFSPAQANERIRRIIGQWADQPSTPSPEVPFVIVRPEPAAKVARTSLFPPVQRVEPGRAPVAWGGSDPGPSLEKAAGPEKVEEPSAIPRWVWMTAIGAAGVLAIGGAAWLVLAERGQQPSPSPALDLHVEW